MSVLIGLVLLYAGARISWALIKASTRTGQPAPRREPFAFPYMRRSTTYAARLGRRKAHEED